jgi:hypothetical protein
VPQHLIWRAFWPAGEPESSRRVAKLVYTNWLSQCDRSREQRNRINTCYGPLFVPDPTIGAMAPADTTAESLEWCISCAFLRNVIMAPVPEFMTEVDIEQAVQRLLETALAAELFRREEGNYPERLEQLIGRGFDEPPTDPFGEGEPIRFRRELEAEEGVTLWSIGKDETDDDGLERTQDAANWDIVIRLKPRASK